MANENDIVSRLILDDSDFIKKIEGANPYIDKLAANFDDLQKEVKASSQVIGKDLVQANEKAAKSIDHITKAAIDDSKALQKQRSDIAEVSLQIAKNKDQSEKLVSVYKKLTDARDKGILLDPQDIIELGDGFDKFAQEVGLSQKQLDLVQESLSDVVAEIQSINAKPIQDAANAISKGATEAEQFSSELKDLSGVNIQELQQKLETLALTTGTNTDEFKATSKAIGEYKARITEADRAVEFYAKSSDSLESALGELEDRMYDLALRGQDNTEEFKRLRDEVVRMKTAVKDTDAQVDRFVDKKTGFATLAENVQLLGAGFQIAEGYTAAFGSENEDLQKSLLKLNGIMAITSSIEQARNILIEQARAKTGALAVAQGLYSTVVGTSTGALKLFRLALAATGIGLLVILLGSLVANWDKVKKSVSENSEALFEGAKTVTKFLPPLNLLIKGIEYLYNNFDKIGSAVKGAGAALNSFFGNFGDSIGKLFSGDFSGAYDSFKSIGKDARAAFDEGFTQGEADRANKALSDELLKTVANQKKRAEILQAGGKETANIQKSILQNELKALELAGADKQEIEDKQHEISLFNAERQKIAAEKSAKERERIAKQVAEATSKLKALQDELFSALNESDLLTDKEKFDLIKQKNIDALVDFKNELSNTAKILGKDVSKELSNVDKLLEKVKQSQFIKFEFFNNEENDKFNIQQLLENVEKRRTIQLQDIESSILSDEAKESLRTEILLQGELERLQILQEYTDKNSLIYEQNALRILEIQNKLNKPIEIPEIDPDDFWGSINTFEDLLNETLDNLFGEEGAEKAKDFLSGLGSLVSEFGNILNEANELQIEAIDKQLDALSERREKTQDELDKELELQKEGLANNVSGKENEVEALLSEEKRLTDEREKIQKEAQRRQLIADTVQQSQSLITSSINIIKGFSQIPFIGLPLGIAAVATLIGFFAKTKAQAFAATKLYTGANRIDDHFGEVGSRSDIPGRGEGYRVVDAVTGQDTNVRISGKEMLLPEDITQSQKRFFKNLKAGKYNFDIADVLDLHSSLKESVNGGVVQQTIINTTQLPSKQWVTYTTKKGVNKAILLEVPKKGEIGSTYIFQD